MEIAPLLHIEPGVTALLGGGGKTTLMYALAEELKAKGPVLVCTSTRIRVPEQYPLLTERDPYALSRALARHRVLCLGTPCSPGKLTAPPFSFPELEALAAYVIVEADGSRGLPLKAHAAHEPVLPKNARRTVLVLGAGGMGRPIREVCHRPALYASLAGAVEDDTVTPAMAACVIAAEGLGDLLYINQVESPAALAAAREIAGQLTLPAVAGSLQKGEFTCLC